jgi:hypothetical protein
MSLFVVSIHQLRSSIMFKSKWLFIVGLAAVLSACATGPKVRTDKDPAADLTAYKTFGFFEQLPTDQPQYSSLMTTRLKQAATRELTRLGYTYDGHAPQLRVNFFLKVSDKQEIRSSPGSARIGRYAALAGYHDIETVDYKAGTLRIDLVDVGNGSLVWLGVAEGKVPEEAVRNPGAAIDEVVASVFSNFPNPPAK